MKRHFWKIIPYFSLIISMVGVTWLAYLEINNPFFSNWLLAISANLISVLFIYFLYELIKAKSEKELIKGIFQYAKSYVDGDIFAILYTLSKFVYGFKEGKSLVKTLGLTKLTKDELKSVIENKKHLGFQIFKLWENTYNYFSKVLENNFVLKKLDDDHILLIINLINAFKKTERDFTNENNYDIVGQKTDEYRVVRGIDINKENIQFPNRYLLMRILEDNKYVVEDFGDFPYENIEKLLNVYEIKPEKSAKMASDMLEIYYLINKWLKLTGGELRLARTIS
jgi:hypothetical protein